MCVHTIVCMITSRAEINIRNFFKKTLIFSLKGKQCHFSKLQCFPYFRSLCTNLKRTFGHVTWARYFFQMNFYVSHDNGSFLTRQGFYLINGSYNKVFYQILIAVAVFYLPNMGRSVGTRYS